MTSRKEGEGGKAKCDTSTQGLRHKGVTEGGGGVKNCPNLHDIIYECSLTLLPDASSPLVGCQSTHLTSEP